MTPTNKAYDLSLYKQNYLVTGNEPISLSFMQELISGDGCDLLSKNEKDGIEKYIECVKIIDRVIERMKSK